MGGSCRFAAWDFLVRDLSLLRFAEQGHDLVTERHRHLSILRRPGELVAAAEQLDVRSAAFSTYAYRGLRERYGMVRAREAILPFDIVLQGSLGELSVGAFPRMRPPRETPDAILFK